MTRLWHWLIRSNSNNPKQPPPAAPAAPTRKQYSRTPLPCGRTVTITDWPLAPSQLVAALAFVRRRRKPGEHRGNIVDRPPPDPTAAGDAAIDHRPAMRRSHLI